MNRMKVLTGSEDREDREEPAGIALDAAVTVTPRVTEDAAVAAGKRPGAVYRVAPLLRVLEDRILVGQVRVWGASDGVIEIEVVIQALWCRDDRGWVEQPLTEKSEVALPEDVLASPAHVLPAETQARVTTVAKGLAEGTRNAVADLRELRYALERRLSEAIRDPATADTEQVLGSLIELGRAVNRGRDQAREAVRGGLLLWVTEDALYHRHRRMLDPTLPARGDDGDGTPLPPWLRTHDAAVRQCRAAEEQLGEEAALLNGMLDAASTIAVARDARAQEDFNTVAAIVATGLGLPALVLSLYGADAYLPFHAVTDARLLLPVAVALLLAAGAGVVVHRRGAPKTAFVVGIALVVVVLALLLLAAVIAPNLPKNAR